jgi:molybdopterin molybdotransferase
VAAGDAPGSRLASGSTFKIMTGAPLPFGADAVVIREDVEDRGDVAVFATRPPPGDNVRRTGEDLSPGDRAVEAGTSLGAAEIGACAALGHTAVDVARRPRVAILSTGDELVDADAAPGPGRIVNSNAWALAAQVAQAGGQPVALGIARDDRTEIAERIRSGLSADVLLTSGGVSAGDFDLVRDVLAETGVKVEFWKVAIKPGKPLVFGVGPSGTLVFGLPGNPVSSMVSFELFARPALRAMLGLREVHRPRAPVLLPSGWNKPPGRAHYLRGRVTRVNGSLQVALRPQQGSGMLSSMIGVNALVEIDAQTTRVAPGGTVTALLLEPV